MLRPQITLTRVDGSVVCERCIVAETPLTRMRGLLGRTELPRGEGILLRPAASIHTFFMRFSIDAVFVGEDGKILGLHRRLRPWRFAGARGAAAVVELAAGESERRALAVGDRLALP